MTDVIAHRGPDGEGHYVVGPVALGHRRLSIIDVSTGGAQPMCNEDGTVWITFNGEIYNYRELRADLKQRGHVFKSESDTEVIVHLYEEIGEDCVQRLKGMFAFAIWDGRNRKLFVARDRVGIKPLYYCKTTTFFTFASEIKALFVDPSLERRFNHRALSTALAYYYLPGEETLFEGVMRLLPGHCLTLQDGAISIRRYWDLDFKVSASRSNFGETVEALKELLSRTVEKHLISDVPVGVLLSGGVDSTAMLRYASMHSSEPIRTFTVGFSGAAFADERPYARLAAAKFGGKHEEITLTAQEFGDFLPKYAWHMEEPICEPPAIALHMVSQLARNHDVKVLLSGEGGDEAFGGYNKYAYLLALETAKSLFGPARGALKLMMRGLANAGLPQLRNFLPMVDLSLSEYYLSCTSSPFTRFNRRRNSLLHPSVLQGMAPGEAFEPSARILESSRADALLTQILRVDTKTWLPDDLLIKADKMTMATSVELRVPFLDSDVLEFAASLPPSFKIRGWPPKRILRAALRDSVPTEILERKKVGFPVPYETWLREELRERVHDTILNPGSGLADFFQREALTGLVQELDRGEPVSQEIFSLLVLELLHEKFIRGMPNEAGSLDAADDGGVRHLAAAAIR